MRTSITHRKDSRSMLKRFTRIATAIAFGGLLCAFPVGSAHAAHHGGGHDGGHGGGYHGGYHGGHGGWGHHGDWGGYYGGPDYYAGPDYYYDYPEP
ncbi:MAG: hypothetical protein WAU82_23540, partial [Candidatus Binatus sp.]